jgi:hypothetical protein
MNELQRTLESALQHCQWCYEERPYVMYESDASLYLSEAIGELKWAVDNIGNYIDEDNTDEGDTFIRGEWISIKTEKPRAGCLCLLLAENNFLCIGRRIRRRDGRVSKDVYSTYGNKEINGVTHWAFLPKKPKERL